jgi:ATP-dependent Lhr-like helicase
MESIRSINVEEKSNERVRPAPVMSRSWRSRWGARDMTVSGGRWFLLPAIITPASALDRAQQSADRVMRSLQRYGFLCRELNVLSVDGPWRQQYEVLSRMEWSGTVRRGYFVEGLSGSQFALPEVRLNEARDAQMIWLSALDPANIYSRVETRWHNGAGEPIRVPRMAGSWIALRAGRPILAAVSHGTRLIPLVDDVSLLEQAVQSVGELLNRLPRDQRHVLTVKQWGDADIVDSPAFAWLQRSGFSRDTQGLRLYRQYA